MAGTLFLVRSRTRSRFSGPCHEARAARADRAPLVLAGCDSGDPDDSFHFAGGSDSEPDSGDTSPPSPSVLEAASGLVPDEGFGTSVAFDGDQILVGAPFAGGRVYAVDLHGDGTPQ